MTKGFGPSPRAIAILRISREEIFGPVMHVAPVLDLAAALALVDAQTTAERGLSRTKWPHRGAAYRRRVEGDRGPRRGRSCDKLAAPIDDSRTARARRRGKEARSLLGRRLDRLQRLGPLAVVPQCEAERREGGERALGPRARSALVTNGGRAGGRLVMWGYFVKTTLPLQEVAP